ncbi:MAG TPA: MMPL family transporter [Solirubrobacteraceae bacterium]
MSSLFTFVAGRRTKWVIALVWLLIAAGTVAAKLPSKFSDAERNESTSFLPGDAESTKALAVTKRIEGGELAPLVIVYHRDGGLTGADRATIARDRAVFNRRHIRATSPFGRPVFSSKGDAALVVAQIKSDGQSDTIADPVKLVRRRLANHGHGLEAKVTGGAGFSADAIEVFQGINGTLVLAAFVLVLVLLILIYRSPIFWLVPIVSVGFAELATRGIGYELTTAGVTVNGQSSSILSILVLGAGTDYALLLVARYREELRRHADRHEAMTRALRSAGPAIFASGLTVIAALLCLMLAKVNGTSGLGPIAALGIAIAMLAMLTLLPALLVICGRWIFFPFIPRLDPATASETTGPWSRLGDAIARRPRKIWVGVVVALLVLAVGLVDLDDGLTQGNSFRGTVESVQGQKLLSASFPSGANAPTDIVVRDLLKVAAVRSAVAAVPGVVSVAPESRDHPGATSDTILLKAVLSDDPFSTQAYALVPKLRAAAKRAGGPQTLVGGATAVEADLRTAAARDTKLIVPIALLVVFLILMVLLRAVVAPLLLIGTVILSFAASLGVGAVVFDVVFGFPGSDPSLPLFAFVFLVALGIDYNIFLMARVREETRAHGTEAGMRRGLAVTGGVITSAGIVLAGTFSALGVLPLVFLTEIGFVVAFGVLLDTFIVRSILVPALVLDLGPKVWWPSKLARSGD